MLDSVDMWIYSCTEIGTLYQYIIQDQIEILDIFVA